MIIIRWVFISLVLLVYHAAARIRLPRAINPKLVLVSAICLNSSSSAIPVLTYLETMTAGAISRTVAQTIMHPANTYKTMLQLRSKDQRIQLTPERLLRGADAQFIMSLPHGAFYFSVVEFFKTKIESILPKKLQFFADFSSSTISTIICSIVSTPQMVLTDRLMAGVYPNFRFALKAIVEREGIRGFYTGWWPALAQKIPSYGLTWMFFQQLKRGYEDYTDNKPSSQVSFLLGAVASAASVCVMIPMDTIKTRLVIQQASTVNPYTGVSDCFRRILKEEGVGSLYRSLTPRLMSVVPMIAIQYGIYEWIKADFLRRRELRHMPVYKADKARSTVHADQSTQRYESYRATAPALKSYLSTPYKTAPPSKKQILRPALISLDSFRQMDFLGIAKL